ncbi:hypothetical protein TCE0_034f10831 [Talaromyces pinophilus]|uniref:Uncharacterized protein n=1 Tax=Talaromyces pinophilus TaxID=128442 RepID=A0A6V8HDF3_TALPI|nr:hypothetical protein ZTR_00052 [Talaromyces verruculosus]PCG89661.1 hypothetical protein PENOC_105560 [Penicillium occitanis (nom. inval.)]PCH08228.1 Hypothetical protein PENO1_007220 [Penicillium occitanis (nom. inval.)]GAM39351.1 hypothetical protein TCE0_034f10831 [Talaromyces pinophilus]
MGVIGRFLKLTTTGGVATIGAHFIWTRNSHVEPLPRTDYLFTSPSYKRLNPNENAVLSDDCIRRVPLSQIDPKLLEKKGKLAEKFCAGVWGGLGYAFQRQYLAKKYQGPKTAHQLWSTNELISSTYEVGTEITDHFQVVEKTDNRIVVRCGDSPLKRDVRESDGLFEMSVDVKKDEGVAEFHLKSVFFNGLSGTKAEGSIMPWHIELLHREYSKIWMESALRNVYA